MIIDELPRRVLSLKWQFHDIRRLFQGKEQTLDHADASRPNNQPISQLALAVVAANGGVIVRCF
jgi:hypothetical protein